MNNLKEFKYENNKVRTIEKNGTTWFVLKDVCSVLGIANSRNVANRLKEYEKGVHSIDTVGGKQQITIINESGFYKVVLRSDKPNAEEFQEWVTSEVLPNIRKHGMYLTNNVMSELLNNPSKFVELLQHYQKEKKRAEYLQNINAQQEQIINELAPKADYTDRILNSKGAVNIGQIAKDYGLSATKLNEILQEEHVQYKRNKQWLLYAAYQDKGYTKSNTVDLTEKAYYPKSTMHTRWTPKGRLFIHNLLKEKGITPLIELI